MGTIIQIVEITLKVAGIGLIIFLTGCFIMYREYRKYRENIEEN